MAQDHSLALNHCAQVDHLNPAQFLELFAIAHVRHIRVQADHAERVLLVIGVDLDIQLVQKVNQVGTLTKKSVISLWSYARPFTPSSL